MDDYEYQAEADPATTVPLKPTGKSTEAELTAWVKDGIYYTHLQRITDISIFRKADLFDQNYQWIDRANSYGAGQSYGLSQWSQIVWNKNDPNRMPTPVFNDGFDKRVNESARLARPYYLPACYAKGREPDIDAKVAAKKLTEVLRYRLEKMEWSSEADMMCYHMPLYGGAWLVSRWEESWNETTLKPLDTAFKCPKCEFILSSPMVNFDKSTTEVFSQAPETLDILSNEAGKVKACPTCPDHPPVEPYKLSLGEAAQNDSVGRPLGKPCPKSQWKVKVESPYNMFPYNLGYNMRPGGIDSITYVHVERLSWIAEHYPENAPRVRPENPVWLMGLHPVAGAPTMLGSLVDTKTFRDMSRVMERIEFPKMQKVMGADGKQIGWQMDKGRHVIVSNGVKLLDADLLMPSITAQGKFVPRIYFDYIPWEMRDGGQRLQGFSMWELMFDPQEMKNEIISQTASVRRHTAVPMYQVPRTMNPEVETLNIGKPGQFVMTDVDPDAPNQKIELFNNQTIAAGVSTELSVTDEFMARIGGSVTEQGSTEPGVDAASAIRQLKESSGEKRAPRIKRQKDSLTRIFTHGAYLEQNFCVDPEPIRMTDEDGNESWEEVKGSELGIEIDVTVEPSEPDREERRQQVTAAISSGVIVPSQMPPATQRRIISMLTNDEIGDELYEDEMIQDNAANREWIQFRDKGRIPVVDPTLDANQIHYEEHGKDAHSEIFRDWEDRADWDGALKILGDSWLMDLNMVAQTPIPNMPMCLQDRILMMWNNKLQMAGWSPQPQGNMKPGLSSVDAFIKVAQWRAHTEAHRLTEQMKMMQAQMQPTLASPGDQATAAGTQVTPATMDVAESGSPGVSPQGTEAQVNQQSQARAMSDLGSEIPASYQTQPSVGV